MRKTRAERGGSFSVTKPMWTCACIASGRSNASASLKTVPAMMRPSRTEIVSSTSWSSMLHATSAVSKTWSVVRRNESSLRPRRNTMSPFDSARSSRRAA